MAEVEEVTKTEAPKKAAPRKRPAPKAKEEKAVAPENWNIKFVGREKLKNGSWRDHEAPKFLMDGPYKILLPSSAQQKAGFYHEKAGAIFRMYRGLYKLRQGATPLNAHRQFAPEKFGLDKKGNKIVEKKKRTK